MSDTGNGLGPQITILAAKVTFRRSDLHWCMAALPNARILTDQALQEIHHTAGPRIDDTPLLVTRDMGMDDEEVFG